MTNSVHIFDPGDTSRYLIFAEGKFGRYTSKTANVILRYQPERVAAVVDSRHVGKTVREVNPAIGAETPIVADVESGLGYTPTHCLIGVAPAGGQLPRAWRDALKSALNSGLHVVSGLHTYLNDDAELKQLAESNGVRIIDLRRSPEYGEISQGCWRSREVPVVLTIAPDCAMGKLTAAWELKNQLENRNYRVGFVATGQTGILLAGSGVVVDAVKGDFISVAMEEMIRNEMEQSPDIIVVEGQGSIYHEGFSAVTLGILHGTMPDTFLFVHRPHRQSNDYGFGFPPYRQMINDYETLVQWFKPAHTIGVQLDTSEYSTGLAKQLCDEVRNITGLPTTDFVRFPDHPAGDELIRQLHLE